MSLQKNRRHFLKRCFGAMAVSSIFGAGKVKARQPGPSPADKESAGRGYHETDHIRDYYRKINF